MTAWWSATRAARAPGAAQNDSDSAVLRKYYEENDYLTSAEGILKVISVILSIVSSVLLFSGGSCDGAPLLVTGAASVVLACAAALACLYAGAALSLSVYAPMGCLYTDLILSTVIGILLLVIAILSMTFCEMVHVIDYVHGLSWAVVVTEFVNYTPVCYSKTKIWQVQPLGLVNAVTVTGSAVAAFVSVTRQLDGARGPAREPRRPPPAEQEV